MVSKLRRATALSWSTKRNGFGKLMVGTNFIPIHTTIKMVGTVLSKTDVIFSEIIV
jgi:hypothetical protein